MNIDIKSSHGLIPAIIQDSETKNVLMMGYMNEESIQKTIETQKVTFFSRSKQRLWTKGEESGNFLNLVDIKNDCDGDTLLIQANQLGQRVTRGQIPVGRKKTKKILDFFLIWKIRSKFAGKMRIQKKVM